jgi:DNA-directed RNA polymerase omega subunit
MKTLNNSRSSEVDTEKCVEASGGNRFELVLMAAARAREITHLNHHSERIEHRHSPVSALLEIQTGKIGREYLRKVR